MSQTAARNFILQSELSEEDEPQTINLVSLDQTYICFDVEQLANAKQVLKLSRCAGIHSEIAWRMRTNAPTRYIVNPSRGIIHDDKPVTLTIELVDNKFHPNHKLIFQAIILINGFNERTIWRHDSAKNWNNVQTTQLKLSTMLMNIETTKYEEENAKMPAESMKNLMEQSSRTGIERIQELEGLLSMLQADTKQFKKNTERTIRLKTILEHALDTRKLSLVDLKRRVMESEQKTKKLSKQLADKEEELKLSQRMSPASSNITHPTCHIS